MGLRVAGKGDCEGMDLIDGVGLRERAQRVELMAPAGSWEALTGALQGGADSVFFGVGKLNMRSGSAGNFSLEDMRGVAEEAHGGGAKCYLTVNTVVYEDELLEVRHLVGSAVEAGVDAVIASDQAVVEMAREAGLPVHISTQISVSNSRAVRFYSRWADVVVLARELTLPQVRAVREAIAREQIKGPSGELVRIEMFAHGAMCMAISGKCYLSLHAMDRSANRGECVQVCRRGYRLSDLESGNEIAVENDYLLSPKDLCTIGILDEMVEAGVEVLKLEGRARGAEYVRTVTQCYREALDALGGGGYTKERIAEWRTRLAMVFNRGFWEGYYLGQRMGEWTRHYGSSATERKELVGVITNYFGRLRVAEARLNGGALRVGDRLYIIGPTTGVMELTVSELRREAGPEESVEKGAVCSFPCPQRARRGDSVYVRQLNRGC